MHRRFAPQCPPCDYKVGRGWVCYRREARGRPEEYLLERDDAEWGNNNALRTYLNISVHNPRYAFAQTSNHCPDFGGSTKIPHAGFSLTAEPGKGAFFGQSGLASEMLHSLERLFDSLCHVSASNSDTRIHLYLSFQTIQFKPKSIQEVRHFFCHTAIHFPVKSYLARSFCM